MAHGIEHFYGVYLLYCKNPRFKGHTYIGFTVNPNRRILQHNRGADKGGAKRTSGRGPWDMTMIVHGFPNMISALRFEWAWQNPFKSRRLRGLPGICKKARETAYDQKVRVMCMMLRSGPWDRLPLTIRWLKQEYMREFSPQNQPPLHMPLAYGPVKIVAKKDPKKDGHDDALPTDNLPSLSTRCSVCYKKIMEADSVLRCYHPTCSMTSHILCLSRQLLGDTRALVPVGGACPRCKGALLWGDLIRYKLGCKDNLEAAEEAEGGDDHWADELT